MRVFLIVLCLVSLGLATGNEGTAPNTVTEAEVKEGWTLLFDGKSFSGWEGLDFDAVADGFWKIENGCIRKALPEEFPARAQGEIQRERVDLFSVETFKDFELVFEWCISPGGNSGLKYNVSKEISNQGGNTTHRARGFEFQVFDDAVNKEGPEGTHSAGSLYDLLPARNVPLKKVGEFNQARILLRDGRGEHWMNGVKVLEYRLGAPEMIDLLSKSKFKDLKGFGDQRAGHIVLQDHRDVVWFKNLKIRRF